MTHRLCLITALAMLAATGAAAEPLNVLPGLWEITTTMHIDGPIMDPAMMAKLPPNVRDQITSAALQPIVNKNCLTAERIRQGFIMRQDSSSHCTSQDLGSTSSALNIHTVCNTAGGFDMDIITHMTAASTTEISGNFDATTPPGHYPAKSNGTITGHFISADCGDVKPR